MKRGRKPGIRVGPTVDSRPWHLLRMKPGERLWFEVPPGRGGPFMKQTTTDIHRNGLKGLRTLRQAFAIVPATRELVEMLIVEYPKGAR